MVHKKDDFNLCLIISNIEFKFETFDIDQTTINARLHECMKILNACVTFFNSQMQVPMGLGL